MQIQGKCVVSIAYILTNDEGQTLDASTDDQPMVYLHDSNSLIPGLEKELNGKTSGDQFKASIQPEDAYGPVNPEMVQQVPKEAFEGVDDIQAGMQFEAQGPEGQMQIVTIEEVGEEGVTINGNHPLAGQVLHFDVTIKEIREATAEEIEHGHVHTH